MRLAKVQFWQSHKFIIESVHCFWGGVPQKVQLCIALIFSIFDHFFKGAFSACLLLACCLPASAAASAAAVVSSSNKLPFGASDAENKALPISLYHPIS